jgi:uncharacterized iron-regulated protein
VAPRTTLIKDMATSFKAGTIISAESRGPVSLDTLMADLVRVNLVYVGEQHNASMHHRIQLEVIKELYKKDPTLAVGMEMFDVTYQSVLDLWSAGDMDWPTFLKRTHWYANWRFDDHLYVNILEFIREKNIRLVGLNLPFCLPPKISIGGIDSLGPDDRKYLPETIDTRNAAHRAYLEEIFKTHHFKQDKDFENFYEAQCVWEESMAESIAKNLNHGKMVVLAGNGHIIRKFGIPQRAFHRTKADYKTIYLASPGTSAELDYADYIWIVPSSDKALDK